MMYIIEAREEHLVDLLSMSKEFHSTYVSEYNLDIPKLSEFYSRLMATPDGTVFVCYEDRRAIAFLAAIKSEIWFGHTVVATELAWWVDPAYRKTGVGSEVLKAFEGWARASKCDAVSMMSLDDGVGKFYVKSGYRLIERAYTKVL